MGDLALYTRGELLEVLAGWNRQLARHDAEVLIRLDDAVNLSPDELRQIINITSRHLSNLLRAMGESE